MSSDGSLSVRLANQASSTQIFATIPSTLATGSGYQLSFMKLDELSPSLRKAMWEVLVDNMRALYIKSSLGWNTKEKKKEFFNDLSRFLVMQSDDGNSDLLGFTVFRFEYEEEEDLLYCYELQISKSHRRRGLGGILMTCLSSLGEAWKMHKIMLTVFNGNSAAVEFYKASGFDIDPASPNYPDEDSDESDSDKELVDYEILSKKCQTRVS